MKLKMLKYLSVIILFFLWSGITLSAQNSSKIQQQFEKALSFYNLHEYENAISEIEKILKKNPDYVDAMLLLSDIYGDSREVLKEIQTLENALRYTTNSLIYYRLGKANLRVGNYGPALDNFEKYLQTKGINAERKAEVLQNIVSCQFAIEALKNPVEFNPVRLPENINTELNEYWPSVSISGEKIVFTRLIKLPSGLMHEDFYISELDSIVWQKAQPISEINTTENEGAQSLSADGRLLFFTACNRPDGFGSCDIYYSIFNGISWSLPKNAGNVVNSGGWDAQPAISSDNRFLFFSSNRPGGFGNKDLWRAELVEIKEDGNLKWNAPKNLGNVINTAGNEISPFIHPNNKNFYFASDFHPGMGGLDLFQCEISGNGTFSPPENLGYPINTFDDEQGLNISSNGLTAYFSSGRVPGFGLDIFTFSLPEELRPEPVSYIKAKITNAETGAVVKAKVDLINLSADSANQRSEMADENGEMLLCLPLNATYAFNVSENGFLFYSRSFQPESSNSNLTPFVVNIQLQPVKTGAEMNLYNIYFETDSFRILDDSEPELQKLATFLKENPGLKVEIQGHTDNSGSSERNLLLSEKRANSVMEYLISAGIAANRLQSKGYGENNPVANNETENGRSLNRRTTVKIMEN